MKPGRTTRTPMPALLGALLLTAAFPLGAQLQPLGPEAPALRGTDVARSAPATLASLAGFRPAGYLLGPGNPAAGEIFLSRAHVSALPGGGFVAVWREGKARLGKAGVYARRFDALGTPVGDAVRVNAEPGIVNGPLVAAGEGGFVVVWNRGVKGPEGVDLSVFARRYDPVGRPLGPELEIPTETAGSQVAGAVAVDPAGNVLVAWTASGDAVEGGADVYGQLFAADGTRRGAPLRLSTAGAGAQEDPRVEIGAGGEFVVAWTHRAPDGTETVLTRRFVAGTCSPAETSLCLGGRFKVEVAWTDPRTGNVSAGRPVPLTGDTGAFWFFSEDNLELMIKVVDGRAANGHVQVASTSLSDVESIVTITDTRTGAQEIYHNPPGRVGSWADTVAFPGRAPSSLAGRSAPAVPPPAPPGASPCGGPADTLCLARGRFKVEVEWTDPRTGTSGRGQGVPLTREAGAFWFFGPESLELLVKVLDGRTANGHFWVFYGALSDVEFTLTVTDLATGGRRTYHNPPYELASRADTRAFQ